ncbi:MAG: GIY-YIG nuclease family protein [Terriglobales bacterium]
MGYVYFAKRKGSVDLFKIGSTGALQLRKKASATADPWLEYDEVIETDKHRKCEAFLHNYLQTRRTKGEFFHLGPEELRQAIEAARNYLHDLPREELARRLARQKSSGKRLVPTQEQREKYVRLLALREQAYRIEQECLRVENELKCEIGNADGLEGIASWRSYPKDRFDQPLFRREHEELFEKYQKTIIERRFQLLFEREPS